MTQENIRVAIAGGGTGGHLFPALNLGKAMQKRWNARLLFFGTSHGIEKGIIPRQGFDIVFLPVRGFQRRFTLQNISFPFNLWRSLALSKKALRQFKPHIVVGTGGYVMGPVLRTAKKFNIPFVIQEQNSFPGVTTRLLAKDAAYVFLAYEEAKQYLTSQARTLVAGNPINLPKSEMSKEDALRQFGFRPGKLTILIIGGSQGAESINRAVFHLVENKFQDDRLQWIWQTGEARFKKWAKKIVEKGRQHAVRILPFITDMLAAYQAADLVVCRAGAMTLSELMAMGTPAVLIPYPFAAANHQVKNAQVLAHKDAAEIIFDNEQLQSNLERTLQRLLQSPQKIEQMRRQMLTLNSGDSVQKILTTMERILEDKGLKIGKVG